MKYLIACLAAVLLSASAIQAQQIHRCGYDELVHQLDQEHPGYKKNLDATFQYAKDQAHASYKNNWRDTAIFRIPVVVHIVYADSIQDLDDSLVYSQIQVLNEDYRRMNADTTQTRAEFDTLAGDAGIEFYLADTDPQGNPTSGITRTTTSNTGGFGISFDDIKSASTGGIDAWPVSEYLNIWVGDLSFFGVPAILGVAYPPDGAPNWPVGQFAPDTAFQGVVVHYAAFGRNNPNATGPLSVVDRGRTATHEVGHYLGLRHIWGDGGGFSGTNGCTVDDGIDDTPNASDASQQTCNLNVNTCADSLYDYPDMIENFMDYSEESCLNMFTQQQIAMMRSNLINFRSSLYDPIDTGFNVGIGETALVNDLTIYPNPSTGTFHINVSQAVSSVVIYNVLGKAVYRNDTRGTSTINMAGFAKGLYLVQVSSGDEVAVRRLVVE